MNVWKKARDQSKPEVVQVIEEYEKRLLLESEDQRNLKVVKDRIFHELIGEDGHGYCRTYGSGVPRRFIYPLAPSSYETTDDLIQKVTESVSKKFQDKLNMLQARIDFLENKEGRGTDQIGQVPDATSGHEIRRESIGEEGNPGSSRDRAMD
ncbi:uncharacterized protein LOC133729171 [Rosa rugosa]|uniref:uncharacterized protein LOC133729171 n=1 Tax=Rosa rugosa TaxID=74645 RepID=UPI002B417988|nr:uncharacterized protein LOC133729171 [Rosa rugosa]